MRITHTLHKGDAHTAHNARTSFLREFFSSPELFYRYGAKCLTRVLYRVKSHDMHHIPSDGPAILICNHISYVDGLIIHTACKRPVTFIIDEAIYNVPSVKYWMDYCGAIPIAPNRESVQHALDMAHQALERGEVVCIFPEGSLTYTGHMIRFRFGIEWIVERSNVAVYPLALKGLWGSFFSRKYNYLNKPRTAYLRHKLHPKNWRRKVHLICGEPIPPHKAKVNHMQRVVMHLKNSDKLR